jgi:signal transduction histidine kinase
MPDADDIARLGAQRVARLAAEARDLVSELRIDDILARLIEAARDLTGARYAAIGVLDEERRGLARFITAGIDAHDRALIGDPPRGRGILGLLIEDPRPLRLHDIGADPRAYGIPTHHPVITTFLGVPIEVRGAAWGNLYLGDRADGRDFDADDEQTVVTLARWAAIAIENARMYETSEGRRAEVERANASLRAMTEIATALGAEIELAPVLDLIVKRARALVDARGVLVLLPDDDELVVAASAGEVMPVADRLPVAGTHAGEVLRAGTPQRVEHVEDDPAFGDAEAAAALLVPLRYRRATVGVLVALVTRRAAGDPTGRREELLRAFAASAATAVVTAQSVEEDRLRVALRAAEAERARWARELHDDTLQALAGIQFLLDGAAHDGGVDGAAVARASERVADEIAALRSLIAELRPPALDELGLGPALQGLVRRVAGGHGLEAVAEIALDPSSGDGGDAGDHALALPAELEIAVYRVAQEALTNAARHADAGHVELHVARAPDAIALRVIDDGHGFDPAAAPPAGFGLAGMRERVALAGGTLVIDASPDGTTVAATFPLAQTASSSRPRSSA